MKAKTAAFRRRLRHDRRHLLDQVVQALDRGRSRSRARSTDRLERSPCPRRKRARDRMIHGIQAHDQTSPAVCLSVLARLGARAWWPRSSSRVRSAGEVQISLGCQTCRKSDQADHRDQRRADIDEPRARGSSTSGIAGRRRTRRRPGSPARSASCRGSRRRPRSARTARSARRTAIAARPWRRGCKGRGRSRWPVRRSACRARRRRPARCWRSATGPMRRAARSRGR